MWLRMGSESLSITANNLLDQQWDNPLNHILQRLVQFSLFVTLEVTGLQNTLCSLYTGDFMCTCTDGKVSKML